MKENYTFSTNNNLAQIRGIHFDQLALRPIYKMLECLFIRKESIMWCHKWDWVGGMEHLTLLKTLMHIDQIAVRLIYKLLEVFIYQKRETERTRKKRPWPTFPRHCFSL